MSSSKLFAIVGTAAGSAICLLAICLLVMLLRHLDLWTSAEFSLLLVCAIVVLLGGAVTIAIALTSDNLDNTYYHGDHR